jgi:amidase
MGFAEYGKYDAVGLASLVRKGEVSAQELLDEAVARTEKLNPQINAVVVKHYDYARAQIEKGLPDGPFRGVPFLLKDLVLLAGTAATYSSNLYKDYVADHNNTIVERYLKAGLTMFGKSASPEFGLTGTTEPRLHGPTRNPWNLAHSPGGSSGGAAAAVIAGILPIAHATDGGGSIRIPAAACGVFGLKPTRARTPVGPDRGEGWGGLACGHAVSISVRDSAALLDATHGPELGSPYVAPVPERPFVQEVGRDPGRLRIAFTDRATDGSAIDPEIAAAVRDVAAMLAKLGHHVEDRAPALGADLSNVLRIIIASSVALTLRQRAVELGRDLAPDDVENVTYATFAQAQKMTGIDYAEAILSAHQAGRRLAVFFETFDAFLAPTLCLPPVELGKVDMMTKDFQAYRELLGRYIPGTSMFNMSGQPSMSVPLAWSKAGLPLGMMFSARYGDEATLFRLAGQLEQERPWKDRKPHVYAG